MIILVGILAIGFGAAMMYILLRKDDYSVPKAEVQHKVTTVIEESKHAIESTGGDLASYLNSRTKPKDR